MLRYLVDNTIVIYPCKCPFLTSKNGMLNRNTLAEATTGHIFRDHSSSSRWGTYLTSLPSSVFCSLTEMPNPFRSRALQALRSLQKEVALLKVIYLYFKKMLETLWETVVPRSSSSPLMYLFFSNHRIIIEFSLGMVSLSSSHIYGVNFINHRTSYYVGYQSYN